MRALSVLETIFPIHTKIWKSHSLQDMNLE